MLELPAPFDGVADGKCDLAADSFLGFFDERSDVAAPDIRLNDDATLAPIALDGRWSGAFLDPHELDERQPLAGRGRNRNQFQCLRVFAVRHRQTYHQRETSSRLDDFTGVDAADRLDGIEHLLCGHAVAGQGLVIDADS